MSSSPTFYKCNADPTDSPPLCVFPQNELITRLSAGAASGRAATAEKTLEKMKSEEGLVLKPFVPKRRTFAFPPVERMGCDSEPNPMSCTLKRNPDST